MGVITLALVAHGRYPTAPPACRHGSSPAALAMALGTYAGGWRVIRTLGNEITSIDMRSGSAARRRPGPCSSPPRTTASRFDHAHEHRRGARVGGRQRFATTRWSLGGRIAIAWLVTLPAAAGMGAVFALLVELPGGVAVLGAAALATLAYAWHARRRLFADGWKSAAPAAAPPIPSPSAGASAAA